MLEKMSFQDYRKLLTPVNQDNWECPVQKILNVFSGKWNLRVIFELTKADSLRFGNLKKEIEGITNTMLSTTLKSLEETGLLTRTQFNEIPPHVEYALSEKGKELYPIFLEMANWAQKYMCN